jgi:hypothetical protein
MLGNLVIEATDFTAMTAQAATPAASTTTVSK